MLIVHARHAYQLVIGRRCQLVLQSHRVVVACRMARSGPNMLVLPSLLSCRKPLMLIVITRIGFYAKPQLLLWTSGCLHAKV